MSQVICAFLLRNADTYRILELPSGRTEILTKVGFGFLGASRALEGLPWRPSTGGYHHFVTPLSRFLLLKLNRKHPSHTISQKRWLSTDKTAVSSLTFQISSLTSQVPNLRCHVKNLSVYTNIALISHSWELCNMSINQSAF